MSTAIRLFLADDHALFTSALKQLLTIHGGIDVVGTAGDARSTVDGVAALRPDVILLDVQMPGPGIVPVVQTLRKVSPQTRIIILSMYDNPGTVQTVLGLGARGYMLKSASDTELVLAIQRVMSDPGAIVLSVSSKVFAPTDDESLRLSERELQIMRLAAEALSNSQIASRLDVKESTVKRHMHNIFTKVGAVSRLDAANKLRAAGILDGDEPVGP